MIKTQIRLILSCFVLFHCSIRNDINEDTGNNDDDDDDDDNDDEDDDGDDDDGSNDVIFHNDDEDYHNNEHNNNNNNNNIICDIYIAPYSARSCFKTLTIWRLWCKQYYFKFTEDSILTWDIKSHNEKSD